MSSHDVREAVLNTCRALADKGYLAGTGGNVALRADETHFAVTPSATDYYTMSPGDICLVRLADLQQVSGDRKPSVESGLHARMLRARPDCDASIHTHQPIASAYALLARPLIPQSQEHCDLLGATIPCAGYAPSGTSWLARKVAKCVRPDVHAYLMRNHGVVCLGADAVLAMRRVEALERACAMFFDQQITAREGRLPARVAAAVREALTRSFAPASWKDVS
jgi:L-fuculose-phosphate aldolase